MGKKSFYKYVIFGFVAGFMLGLIGSVFEDYNHNITVLHALSSVHHYIAPIILGIFSGIFGFLFWKRKTKQTEAFNNYAKNLRALLSVNTALLSTIDLESVLQIIIDESTRLTNLDTGAIYLHENEKLYLGATTPPLPNDFPKILRYDLLANHPHIQKSLLQKQPVVLENTESAELSDAEREVVKFRGLRSIIYIPLIIENRPVGTLILSTIHNTRTFTEQEIDMYSIFSGQAALTIENAHLYKKSIQTAHELRQQNEEFLTLNEELSESNLRIRKINDELKIAKEKAEESDKLKSAFLENISHEVRTPMNSILGFTSLLIKKDLSDEKCKQFTDVIQRSTYQLLNIIDNTITLAQIETNQLQVNKMPFSPYELLSKIYIEYNLRKQIIEKKHVELILKTPEQPDLQIINDYTRINQIFSILLDNALKFTETGSVEFNYTIDKQRINFTVKDSGIGIAPEKQETIFKSFTQADKYIRQSFGGLGVGLSIALGLIKLLDGNIAINSRVGSGTEITFGLPI